MSHVNFLCEYASVASFVVCGVIRSIGHGLLLCSKAVWICSWRSHQLVTFQCLPPFILYDHKLVYLVIGVTFNRMFSYGRLLAILCQGQWIFCNFTLSTLYLWRTKWSGTLSNSPSVTLTEWEANYKLVPSRRSSWKCSSCDVFVPYSRTTGGQEISRVTQSTYIEVL